MLDAVSLIQSIVRDQLRAHKTSELAIVTAAYPHAIETDSNNYEVDVRLRDSGLEIKRVPVCCPRIGAAAIPNKDDLVLLTYLNGDINSAIVTGRLYNDIDRPPQSDVAECVYVSPDKPATGVRRFYFELPNGNTLTLDDDKLVLEMGQTTLTINNSGDVELNARGALSVTASGDTTIQSQGGISLSAGGDVSIEGANIAINSSAGLDLIGGASTTLKGSSVSIAGQISFSAG